MSEVPRFRERMGIVLNETKKPVASGDLVRYSDYQKLEAENEKLKTIAWKLYNHAGDHSRHFLFDEKERKEIEELLKEQSDEQRN
jgi:hypothetical protein